MSTMTIAAAATKNWDSHDTRLIAATEIGLAIIEALIVV
ncbi:MAG: hypothetical protein JWM76_4215, partial [Pseudonocardiales bacterium]|nr:hypothetical protein [Pseudonocardiales bacterium]